jgi:8-oxo-dGTP diphosphatase
MKLTTQQLKNIIKEEIARLEENGNVSRDQLEALKMQIIYYLLAWGPKQDKDIIRYITKQARGGHWEHVSEDELRKSVFWAFSELKSEGTLAWRREVGSHGVKTNWWFLTDQHKKELALSRAGGQEEMFLQEVEDTNKIAKAVIVNEQGEVLILKRSSYSKYAGSWDLPGGHIEEGELAADGVRREVFEETNLEIMDPEELYVKGRVTYFRANLPQQEISLSDEHTEYKYINSEELQEINIAEKYRNAIEYVL